jgi:hypothetical protein
MPAFDAEIEGRCAVRPQIIRDQSIRNDGVFPQKLAYQFQRGVHVALGLDQHIQYLAYFPPATALPSPTVSSVFGSHARTPCGNSWSWRNEMFALLLIVFLVEFPFAIDAATSGSLAALATPAVLIAGFLVYFAPTIAAGQRGHLSANAIFIVNLFFGWTLLGWPHRADLALTAVDRRVVLVPRGKPVRLEDY